MTRFGWRHDLADYGPPRFACTPRQWLDLCRLHQNVSTGVVNEWPDGPPPVPPRFLFARYLIAHGVFSERVP